MNNSGTHEYRMIGNMRIEGEGLLFLVDSIQLPRISSHMGNNPILKVSAYSSIRKGDLSLVCVDSVSLGRGSLIIRSLSH